MLRELTIIVEVLDDSPIGIACLDVEAAVRRALENERFDVGRVDVRVRDLAPAERSA